MNLKKSPKKVLEALVAVEGKEWLEAQKEGKFKGFSVFEAMKELKKSFVKNSASALAIIYGRHGWNRYRVTLGGEVQFIELQAAGKDAVEKARKAGFEMV